MKKDPITHEVTLTEAEYADLLYDPKLSNSDIIFGEVVGIVDDHINVRVGNFNEPHVIYQFACDKTKYKVGEKVKIIITTERSQYVYSESPSAMVQ